MKDLLHPSLLQINYLMTLEKIEKKRGCVGTVADICGVSHGPVSRFFKECVNYGYLTEQYTFLRLALVRSGCTSAFCRSRSLLSDPSGSERRIPAGIASPADRKCRL